MEIKNIQELRLKAGKLRNKLSLSQDEEDLLWLSSQFAIIMNIIYDSEEELQYLIYQELKEDFEKSDN